MEESCYTGLWVFVLLISCHGKEGEVDIYRCRAQKHWASIYLNKWSVKQRNIDHIAHCLLLQFSIPTRDHDVHGLLVFFSIFSPFCLSQKKPSWRCWFRRVQRNQSSFLALFPFGEDILRTAALGSLLFLISSFLLLSSDSCHCLSLLTTWNQHDIQTYASCSFATHVLPVMFLPCHLKSQKNKPLFLKLSEEENNEELKEISV